MLRITTNRDQNSLTLRLEGQIEGPWVEVLRNAWGEAMGRNGEGGIVVDLGGVSFANTEGRNLLLAMRKRGVKLIKPSGFMSEVLNTADSVSTTTAAHRNEGE